MIALRSLQRAALPALGPSLLALALLTSPSLAQQSYKSPEDAAAALAAAVKSGPSDILKVLGRAADDIVSSGDEVADADIRQRFTSLYDQKHSIKAEGNKKATLLLGPEDFPFPIPLENAKAGWEFNTAEGRIEVLRRRIGRNELDAIQTSLAYVDAQNEYADKDHGEGVGVYAQRIVSTPGKKDGLFWRDDADPSPLGALAAEASREGYRAGDLEPAPYHGYYFRILKGQGPDAPGGALNYVVKGKMIGGFGLIAWPAEYGNSGVMTFLVNHNGVVYQKDLGPRTDFVAKRLMLFDPDQTWKKADAAKP
ncbi:DUF2950 domain-containing protein [Bradyrhizobium liaoningense]|uniref:DUF2950 domain-containing protein n=1 Tax=Bradyrhizobium liaoningense TaxID=43992 RepID=UPI001BA88265|nr:DUF2950 domain-containing protein [Bradyrhizobium liaoningense]MBR0713282.1 DUF2950 domain-containing protein [Bradyrhizobium liaoningense]